MAPPGSCQSSEMELCTENVPLAFLVPDGNGLDEAELWSVVA